MKEEFSPSMAGNDNKIFFYFIFILANTYFFSSTKSAWINIKIGQECFSFVSQQQSVLDFFLELLSNTDLLVLSRGCSVGPKAHKSWLPNLPGCYTHNLVERFNHIIYYIINSLCAVLNTSADTAKPFSLDATRPEDLLAYHNQWHYVLPFHFSKGQALVCIPWSMWKLSC